MLFLPFSALDKILGFEGAVKQAQEVFAARRLAAVVLLCGAGDRDIHVARGGDGYCRSRSARW